GGQHARGGRDRHEGGRLGHPPLAARSGGRMTAPIPVVTVDDEPLAREKLRRRFEADRGFAVVGEAGDGEGAVRVLTSAKPMLVCLDIKLPGISGLDVLRRVEPRPIAVIFTTAYDQFALSAFELAA